MFNQILAPKTGAKPKFHDREAPNLTVTIPLDTRHGP